MPAELLQAFRQLPPICGNAAFARCGRAPARTCPRTVADVRCGHFSTKARSIRDGSVALFGEVAESSAYDAIGNEDTLTVDPRRGTVDLTAQRLTIRYEHDGIERGVIYEIQPHE